jgi:hypothetical protein
VEVRRGPGAVRGDVLPAQAVRPAVTEPGCHPVRGELVTPWETSGWSVTVQTSTSDGSRSDMLSTLAFLARGQAICPRGVTCGTPSAPVR